MRLVLVNLWPEGGSKVRESERLVAAQLDRMSHRCDIAGIRQSGAKGPTVPALHALASSSNIYNFVSPSYSGSLTQNK